MKGDTVVTTNGRCIFDSDTLYRPFEFLEEVETGGARRNKNELRLIRGRSALIECGESHFRLRSSAVFTATWTSVLCGIDLLIELHDRREVCNEFCLNKLSLNLTVRRSLMNDERAISRR